MPGSRSAPVPSGQGDFIDALNRARATSRSTAVALGGLPVITAEHLGVLLEADIVREGAPGTYYVTTADQRRNVTGLPSQPFTPMRVALMMAVWLVVIAVPFLVWLVRR
jgi:hypothetical protein